MPRPLRVGIQLPEVERDVRWPEYVAMAKAAEDSGFDSLWVGDHLLYRSDGRPERGPWDAWTLLAGLAAVTERVRLGPPDACLGLPAPGLRAGPLLEGRCRRPASEALAKDPADDREQRRACPRHRASSCRYLEHLVRRLRQYAGGVRVPERASERLGGARGTEARRDRAK